MYYVTMFQIFDFSLSADDMREISKCDCGLRVILMKQYVIVTMCDVHGLYCVYFIFFYNS